MVMILVVFCLKLESLLALFNSLSLVNLHQKSLRLTMMMINNIRFSPPAQIRPTCSGRPASPARRHTRHIKHVIREWGVRDACVLECYLCWSAEAEIRNRHFARLLAMHTQGSRTHTDTACLPQPALW